RIRDGELVRQSAIIALGIERIDDAPLRLLTLRAAEPFGHELEQHIGKRPHSGQQDDQVSPWVEPTGLGGMHNENHIQKPNDYHQRHRLLPRFTPASPTGLPHPTTRDGRISVRAKEGHNYAAETCQVARARWSTSPANNPRPSVSPIAASTRF